MPDETSSGNNNEHTIEILEPEQPKWQPITDGSFFTRYIETKDFDLEDKNQLINDC